MLSVINGVLLFIFTLPILDPSLCIATPPGTFGCIYTMDIVWPGTWLLFAYIFWIAAGVLGTLGFAGLFYLGSNLAWKKSVNSGLSWLAMVFYEVGVLGATGIMAAIGYVGGNAYVTTGNSAAFPAQAIATKIIPPLSSDPTSPLNDMPPVVEALFIGIALLGLLLGLLAYISAKREKPMEPMQPMPAQA